MIPSYFKTAYFKLQQTVTVMIIKGEKRIAKAARAMRSNRVSSDMVISLLTSLGS
jgi:hypothetical protein